MLWGYSVVSGDIVFHRIDAPFYSGDTSSTSTRSCKNRGRLALSRVHSVSVEKQTGNREVRRSGFHPRTALLAVLAVNGQEFLLVSHGHRVPCDLSCPSEVPVK